MVGGGQGPPPLWVWPPTTVSLALPPSGFLFIYFLVACTLLFYFYKHIHRIMCVCVCVCSDLTGSMDGSVRMWEFGTQRVVSQQRSPGTPSITEIRFTPQGNKYGVTDTSGKLYLWQGIHTSTKMPYKVRHAHRLLVISNRLLIM